MKSKIYIAIAIPIIFLAIFWFKGAKNITEPTSSPTVTISNIVIPTPSLSPQISVTSNPKPSSTATSGKTFKPSVSNLPTINLAQLHNLIEKNDGKFYYYLTQPATCAISGKITFLSHNMAQIEKANFIYSGIDSPARQIKWVISPSDDFQVSPNLAAPLYLPEGENIVGVNLPLSPKYKNYTLTASVTYGRVVNGGLTVSESKCSGSVVVDLSY